jgi:hypothetical protein
MAADVRADERTDRHDVQAARADVVERAGDEPRTESPALRRGRDFRVDERDPIRGTAVENLADEAAVQEQFVAG